MEVRNTPARRLLVEVLRDADAPITVGELRGALADAGLEVNKTTVYRQLNTLVAEELVREVDLGEGRRRFEIRGNDGDHAHFVCTRCGGVTCFAVDPAMIAWAHARAAQQGATIDSFSLEFRGLCAGCSEGRDR